MSGVVFFIQSHLLSTYVSERLAEMDIKTLLTRQPLLCRLLEGNTSKADVIQMNETDWEGLLDHWYHLS